MVHVPRDTALVDPLTGLGADERERLSRSERRLLDYLDRLVRRGTWPVERTPHGPEQRRR
jgi:hypothetical protein